MRYRVDQHRLEFAVYLRLSFIGVLESLDWWDGVPLAVEQALIIIKIIAVMFIASRE